MDERTTWKMRLKFQKGGDLRWLSHLELNRLWQRALSRAQVPIKYSEGFSPHPKISFGPALPVGVAGENEYLDLVLLEQIDPADLIERVNALLPEGARALAGAFLPDGARS